MSAQFEAGLVADGLRAWAKGCYPEEAGSGRAAGRAGTGPVVARPTGGCSVTVAAVTAALSERRGGMSVPHIDARSALLSARRHSDLMHGIAPPSRVMSPARPLRAFPYQMAPGDPKLSAKCVAGQGQSVEAYRSGVSW